MMEERRALLGAALEGIGDVPDVRVGICARGLGGPLAGEGVGVGEDLALPSASLIKLLVLAELLRQADSGRASLEEKVQVREEDVVGDSEVVAAEKLPAALTVGRLAEAMILASDNAATNLLISLLGDDRVNDLAWELGMRSTVLRRKMMDFVARSRGEENLTSASDIVALLAAI